MKIQIIRLEMHDDLLTARDKLSWCRAARALLVWPKRGVILTRPLDLVLLRRVCQDNGSQLGLVSNDPKIKINASELGIPVFSSEESALKSRWKAGSRKNIKRIHPPTDLIEIRYRTSLLPKNKPGNKGNWFEKRSARLFFFCLAILSIIIAGGAFYPSARIILSPDQMNQEAVVKILASSQIMSLNISGTIPARTISVIVEGNSSIPVSGTALFPDQFAMGQVTFSNLVDHEVDVPAGTIIVSSGKTPVKFVTTQSNSVSSGIENTINIPIRALSAGSQGNQPAGAINAIEGVLGTELSVINPEPTAGGSDKSVTTVSQADYEKLRTDLTHDLTQTALDQIKSRLGQNDVFVQNSIEVKNVLNENSEPEINQPADLLNLSLRLEITGLYLSGDDLLKLGEINLDATLPGNCHPLNQSLTIIKDDNKANLDEDQMIHWQFTARRRIEVNLSNDEISNTVAGMNPTIARIKLDNDLPVHSDPQIEMTPSWWPMMPIFSFRIHVSEVTTDANSGN